MIPGNILVVDNNYADVADVIESCEKAGMPVIYLQSPPRPETCPSNVRLVVLDLDLDGCGNVSDQDVEQAVLVLQRVALKAGYFLVVLWSIHIDDKSIDWAKNIREKYIEQTGGDLRGDFLKAFGKKQVTKDILIEKIQEWIDGNPQFGTVFGWERIVEEAMDETVSDVSNTGGISTILRALEKEVGKNSLPRELVNLFTRILLRHSSTEEKIARLTVLIERVLHKREPLQTDILEWYSGLHYFQAYFTVDKREPLWTGDILKKSDSDEFRIVITPACDFAQKKCETVKLVHGIAVNALSGYDRDDPATVPEVARWIGKDKQDKYWKKEDISKSLFFKGQQLPKRLYPLHFLKKSQKDNKYFHLIFDFSRVSSVKAEIYRNGNIKIPKGWERICRLDSPYCQNFLQSYTSFAARIGVPEIPDDVSKKEINKIGL
jgi:hypothetical protein